MCSWPFALKMFWAPLVDTLKLSDFVTCLKRKLTSKSSWFSSLSQWIFRIFDCVGKRKTWLVPSQIGIALGMYYLSMNYELLISDLEGPGLTHLTIICFLLYVFAATQDIAVDGWALTMLSGPDVHYAGTCNTVGQTAGYFVAFSGFIGLESFGICTLSQFMMFWAYAFVIVTGLVALFKQETKKDQVMGETVESVYRKTAQMFIHPEILILSFLMLTWKIPFNDGLVGFKLQEMGIPHETIAAFSTAMFPLSVLFPFLLTRVIGNTSSMAVARKVYPWRVLSGLLALALIHYAPSDFEDTKKTETLVFYVCAFLLLVIQGLLSTAMFVSQMALFSRISDPAMGGTYMTVLNTIANIGGNLGSQISLRGVDILARYTGLDGFYAFTVFGVFVGLLWWYFFSSQLIHIQNVPLRIWKIKN